MITKSRQGQLEYYKENHMPSGNGAPKKKKTSAKPAPKATSKSKPASQKSFLQQVEGAVGSAAKNAGSNFNKFRSKVSPIYRLTNGK